MVSVTLNGEPVHGAIVRAVPVADAEEASLVYSGTTDVQGRAQLHMPPLLRDERLRVLGVYEAGAGELSSASCTVQWGDISDTPIRLELDTGESRTLELIGHSGPGPLPRARLLVTEIGGVRLDHARYFDFRYIDGQAVPQVSLNLPYSASGRVELIDGAGRVLSGYGVLQVPGQEREFRFTSPRSGDLTVDCRASLGYSPTADQLVALLPREESGVMRLTPLALGIARFDDLAYGTYRALLIDAVVGGARSSIIRGVVDVEHSSERTDLLLR